MKFIDDVNLTLAIGSDHAGFLLKSKLIDYLQEKQIDFKDVGTFIEESVDYPDYAVKVAKLVASGKYTAGILVCGTGLGMSIVANKIPGIYAALCNSTNLAEMSRRHNDANILCLGGRIISVDEAKSILNIWLQTPFDDGRHALRINKIKELTDRT